MIARRAVNDFPSAFRRLAGLAAAVAIVAPWPAGAQNYPARPIRIIVPNTAGSATDIATRLVAQRLAESMGQQTVVDNRAGAAGQIGHEITMKATPDGYTLLVSTSTGLVLGPLVSRLPYDPVRDFSPVSLLVISPQLLFSHVGLPVRNVSELVELARTRPGQLNCASPGFGTTNHMGCELLKSMTKISVVHVPYKGTAPAISDVVGGQVQFMFNSMPAVLPLARGGKVRALGHGGIRRSPAAPEIPTIAESIPGFQVGTWYALVAPAGLPPAIAARLNGEVRKMFGDAAFARRFIDMGQEPAPTTPTGLHEHMRTERARWAKVIEAAGLKPER